MAIVTLNPTFLAISGRVGGIVYKTYRDKIVATRVPRFEGHVPSVAQRERRDRMRDATAYAKRVYADPAAKAIYVAAAKELGRQPFRLAVSDFLAGCPRVAFAPSARRFQIPPRRPADHRAPKTRPPLVVTGRSASTPPRCRVFPTLGKHAPTRSEQIENRATFPLAMGTSSAPVASKATPAVPIFPTAGSVAAWLFISTERRDKGSAKPAKCYSGSTPNRKSPTGDTPILRPTLYCIPSPRDTPSVRQSSTAE